MNFKNKKLLVLAGAGTHSKVVHCAKEMGIYTIVTDYLPDSPAKAIADEAWMFDIMDIDGIVKKCKEVGIDGVLNFCIDPAQWPYFEISSRLGLPCYGNKHQFEVLTDKMAFKKYCVEHNVDVIPEYSMKDIQNDDVEYPIFIKPSMSRGSRGQTICYTKQEVFEAYKRAELESSDGCALCEKYMGEKQDLGTAFYVINGEPFLVKLGDRLRGKPVDHMDKQVMCTRLPSHFAPIFEKNVAPRVKAMIKSLEVQFGPVFMQGFIDGNTVRYYDPAMRMPGGDYDLVLKEATGFDTVKSAIHFALTGDTTAQYGTPDRSAYLNDGIGLLFTFSARPGKMEKVVGLEEMMRHPNIIYGRQITPVGTVIPDSGDIQQRVAAIGAYIPHGKSPEKLVDEIYSTYYVYDDKGEDMIISRIDGNLL